MISQHVKISRGMLMCIIFCFFLPFAMVSCSRAGFSSTISGINLVTGAPQIVNTPEGPRAGDGRIPSTPSMVLTFISAIVSFITTFKLKDRLLKIVLSSFGIIGFLAFLSLKSTFDDAIRGQRDYILTFEPAFWLAWTLTFTTFAFNAWLLYQDYISSKPKVENVSFASSGGNSILCPHCGKYSHPSSKFCSQCGSPF